MSNNLPEEFQDLERYVPAWVHETERGRNQYRVSQDMDTLREFYDSMMPRMDAIAQALDAFPLNAMPRRAATLLQLAQMAMEVAPSIEYYNAPDVPDSVEYSKFEILDTPPRYQIVD